MAISVACPSCERRFQAPPQFEGKRIKCKACGEIFVIPVSTQAVSVDDDDPDAALSALAESVRGIDSPNRLQPGTSPPMARKAQTNGDAATGKNALTPNVLTFSYPWAEDVDRWLPASLAVLCFLILADVVAGPDTRDAVWIGMTRFITMSVLYCMLIFPLTMVMINKASREARFAMPPQAQFRCFAVYLPAFLLTAWLFSQPNSGFFLPMIGSILGLGISSGLLFLLFRLREPDVVAYCVQGAGGFLGGLIGSIFLAVILNSLTQMIVTDNKAQRSVPASPYAGGLSWVMPPPPHREEPQQAPSQGIASGSTPQSTPASRTPQSPSHAPAVASSSTLVDSVESGRIPGIIDAAIEPLSNSPVFAVQRNSQNGISIEPWTSQGTSAGSSQDWQKLHGTLTLPTGAAKKFVISTDGSKLAWIAEFPRLSVQVWSFADATVIAPIPLDKSQGTAELIGFVDSDRLLIERGNSKEAAGVPPPQHTDGQQAAAPPEPVEEPNSVFGGFKVNPSELAREHAAAGDAAARHADDTPTRPDAAEPPTDDSFSPAHAMEIIDTSAGTTVCNFDLPALVTDFVSGAQSTNIIKGALHLGTNVAISTTAHRLVAAANSRDIPTLMQFDLISGKRLVSIKITEVDPSQAGSLTGLAYSNDGTRLATLFEHNDSAVLLAYDAGLGRKLTERDYPYGPLEGTPHSQPDSGAIAWLDPAPLWLLYGQGFISTKTGAHLKSADLGLGTIISQRVLDGARIQLLVTENGGRQVHVVDLNPAAGDADAKP